MISDYTFATGRLGNPSFFGTVQELADLAYEQEGIYSRYMENLPAYRYWVYRSPNCFGTNSYGRRNTCFWVFVGEEMDTDEDALTVLVKTGLREVIDTLCGSVVFISPLGEEWSQEDADSFVRLQRMALDCMMDYYGSFGTNYFIGIGKGADFIHDYITGSPEIACTCAGAITVGGSSHGDRVKLTSADFVLLSHSFPAYLCEGGEEVADTYLSMKDMVEASYVEDGMKKVYTSRMNPLLQVVIDQDNRGTLAEKIRRGYENFLSKRMCIPVGPGRNSFMDSTYWALGRRWDANELGLKEIVHEDGKLLPGTEIRRWYGWIPEEAELQERKIPLILLLHGHCDDPRSLAEQCGFLELAGRERLAVFAPEHQYIKDLSLDDLEDPDNKTHQLGRFVDYVLQEYPFLDPEKVYVTGFSRGGLNTCMLSFLEPERFAAVAPLSGLGLFGVGEISGETVTVERWIELREKEGKTTAPGLPAYILVCGRDSVFASNHGLRAHLRRLSHNGDDHGGPPDALNIFRTLNGLPCVPVEEYDFKKYPFWGFETQSIPGLETPDLFMRRSQITDENGLPILRFDIPEGIDHALYYVYAQEMWKFCRHFRRDQATKKVVRI